MLLASVLLTCSRAHCRCYDCCATDVLMLYILLAMLADMSTYEELVKFANTQYGSYFK